MYGENLKGFISGFRIFHFLHSSCPLSLLLLLLLSWRRRRRRLLVINRSTETFYPHTHYTASHHTKHIHIMVFHALAGDRCRRCRRRTSCSVLVMYRRKVNGQGMASTNNNNNTITGSNLVCKSRKLNRGKAERWYFWYCVVLLLNEPCTSHRIR